MKIVLLVFVSAWIVVTSTAQRFRAGLSSGIDASRMAFNEAGGTPLAYKNKLAGGIFTEAVLSKVLSVQAEANYSPQGNAAIDGQNSRSLNFNYITFPLMLKLYGTKNIAFIAGGQFGILMDAKSKLNNDPAVNYKSRLKSKDYYAIFGVEYCFENGVFAGCRYHDGLTDIALPPAPNFHNRYFSFRIGYSFGRKK